jgi:site-specific recombinase XerD
MKSEKEIESAEISKGNWQQLRVFLEQIQLKGYSQNTLKTYRNEFMRLLKMIGNYPVDRLTQEQLRRYFLYCHNEEKLQENTIHSRINAVKFYFEQVLGRDTLFFNIPRPKKPLSLVRFFNQAEIITILKSTGNLKHKTMLMLAYSAGLRVSEVINLKTRNIDGQRMCILLEAAKGKKDRMVMLSPVLLIMLREYWKKYRPRKDGFLFEGQTPGTPYSSRSLQLVLQAAKKKAGILKPGSIHALRHSFATHLLDKGTDVTMIMKLLGHNDLKTTLRYLHVTNRDMMKVISPLDDLMDEI